MKTENKFMQKYGGWLFTALCSFGVIGTSVLAAKEAPDAKAAIDKAEKERGKLTVWEKAKIAAPIYAPAIIAGGITIGGMFGTQAFNSQQQMVIAAAGAVAAEKAVEYDKYRMAIQAEQGNAVDKRALERAKMREAEFMAEIERLKRENGPFLYSISTLPGLLFQARPADIYDAFMHFNRNLILKSSNTLSELYEFIGIPTEFYDGTDAEKYGWDEYTNASAYDCTYYDFHVQEIKTSNGIPVRFISMSIDPYDLSVDYDYNDITNHFYPGHSPEKAKAYIENLILNGKDGVVEIDHPYLFGTCMWGF